MRRTDVIPTWLQFRQRTRTRTEPIGQPHLWIRWFGFHYESHSNSCIIICPISNAFDTWVWNARRCSIHSLLNWLRWLNDPRTKKTKQQQLATEKDKTKKRQQKGFNVPTYFFWTHSRIRMQSRQLCYEKLLNTQKHLLNALVGFIYWPFVAAAM